MKKGKGFLLLAMLLFIMSCMLLPETTAAEQVRPEAEKAEETKEESDGQSQQTAGETEEEQTDLITVEAEIQGAYQFGDMPSSAENEIAFFSMDQPDEEKEEAAKEFIYRSLMKGEKGVDISDYDIPVSRLNGMLASLLNEHADLYFVSQRYSYSCVDIDSSVDSSVYILIFTFVETDGEAFYKETRAALSVVKEGMSDLQKVIALHDYLAINCEYDKENYDNHTIPDESYSAYGVLVNHTGVCNGYALAYGYLLEQVGIRSFKVRSAAMNHAWNLVELDGSYYHVDVTWDDPTWDLVGRARHQYMLKSDNALAGHYDWEVSGEGYSAANTKYDNVFWNDVDSPLVLDGEQWNDCYYIIFDSRSKTGKIKKTSLSTLSDAGTEIADIGRWENKNWYWGKAYSGLSLYQNRLYYNDTSSICSIAKDGTDKRVEFEADTTSGYIYGSAFCQGKVCYSLHTTPNFTGKETVLTADIAIKEEEPTEFPVKKVLLSEDELVLLEGETAVLQASLAPAYTTVTDSDISWESSNPSVATVQNGTVTAVSAGQCTITATAGGKQGTCELKVYAGHHQGDIASGRDGRIVWRIDANGTLILEGTGDFQEKRTERPWSWDYKEKIKAAKINVSKITDVSYLLYGCSNLESIEISGFDTSRVTDMSFMFTGCSSLSDLDLSGLDTVNVTNMSSMFSGCSSLTNLDVSGFDTSRVTDMSFMFSGCSSLTNLDLSSFDTSSLVYTYNMFYFSFNLKNLDLSRFDTSNVIDMEYMSRMLVGCLDLEEVRFPANLAKAIALPQQEGNHWEDENGEIRSEAVKGLPSAMTYYSVADGEQNPSGGGNEGQNPSGDGNEGQAPSEGSETPNPSGGGEGQSPSEGNGEQDSSNPNQGNTDQKPDTSTTPTETSGSDSVTSVNLNKTSVTLLRGKTILLTAAVEPNNAIDKTVKWSTSDNKVATVTNNGNVEAIGMGEATITAQAGGKTATCKVTVPEVKLTATSAPLQVKSSTTAIKVDEKYPFNDKVKSWESSNKKVAAVNKNGKITAKKKGTAKITVTMESGATATCKITVQTKKVTTKKLKMSQKKIILNKGKSQKLEVTRNPITATEKITWSSSKQSVVTVNKNGKVKAKKKGTATITAKTSNGKKATCKITVK